MTTRAAKLKAAADAAAEVRAYQTDPDVVALRVERVRGWVDRLIWTGMVLGLLFTMANVAHFAAGDARIGSLVWTTAWLLDPMVSLVLIGVLMGEQIINRHGLDAGGWVRTTKWVALGCTYAMNTWQAWASLHPSAILLHSVPPAIVFCAAEAVVTIRQRITESVNVAHRQAVDRAAALRATEAAGETPGAAMVRANGATARMDEVAHDASPARTLEAARSAVRSARESAGSSARGGQRVRTAPRTSSRTGTRADGAVVVDRDAIVAELAAEILTAGEAGAKWSPDYPALMERTGRKRRWCEGVVSDARTAALRSSADDAADRADDASRNVPHEDPRTESADTVDVAPHGSGPEYPQSQRADRADASVAGPDDAPADAVPGWPSGELVLTGADGGER
ncbi:hypothetical protein [Actinomadura montaniterrae]|uniref:DUF2637 domain-containing protein n=1 Tax=Actinomadura montaniterrae TaxID=1803903 RepID=A0A6L3VUA4_9ACTN|nr:hypothetical protein [Actinomadura montaniterrae]KAB2379298.1 hypothetical protein F9B16_21035 [Actinomadura montaniterrae]